MERMRFDKSVLKHAGGCQPVCPKDEGEVTMLATVVCVAANICMLFIC